MLSVSNISSIFKKNQQGLQDTFVIEFDNKVPVFFQWAWNYFTRKRGVRLITDENPSSLIANKNGKNTG